MNTQSDSLDTKVDLYGALKKLESSCLKLSIAIGDFSISYDDAIEIIYTFYDLEKLAVNIIDTIPKENENGEITKILGNIAKYKNAIDLYYNAHKDDKNFKEVEKNFHISKLNKLLEETKSIIEAPTENKIDDFLNRRGQFLDEATIWCQYIELYPDEPTLFDDLLKARNQIHKLKDEMVTTRRYDKLKDIIYGQEETKV